MELTEEEKKLIFLYREIDQRGKENVYSQAEFEYKYQLEQDKKGFSYI